MYAIKEVERVLLEPVNVDIKDLADLITIIPWLDMTCVIPNTGLYRKIRFWYEVLHEQEDSYRIHNVCFFEKNDGTVLVVADDEDPEELQKKVLEFLGDKEKS